MRGLLIGSLLLACGFTSHAASFQEAEMHYMQNRANTNGSVPVLVGLTSVIFDDIVKDPQGFRELSNLKSREVLNELGKEALIGTNSEPELGGMNVWVTPKGLEILKLSRSTVKLALGADWNERILIPDNDGSLSSINSLLSKSEFIEVELTLDVDGVEFDIDSRTGKSSLIINTSDQKKSAASKARMLADNIGLSGLDPQTKSRSGNITLTMTSSVEDKVLDCTEI